jgi:hypothetical protein
MANPTTNYGFVLPTPTDLVTDLPADFDVALQGVDTRLKALQPGTTLGDIAYSSATANTNTRLPLGTSLQQLRVNSGATAPEWFTPAASTPTYIGAAVGFSADKTIANVTTTTLTFDTELMDSNGFHDTSSNTSRLTIPSGYAGKYRISAQLFPVENSAGRREIRFVKNGTVLYGWNMNGYGTMEMINFYAYVNASVADYYEVTFRQSSGGNLTLYGTDSVGGSAFCFSIDYLGV